MIISNYEKNYLLDYSERLTEDINVLCAALHNEENVVFQIKKSSSSVFANIREANYGQSVADMISKYEIALKEVYETEGWIVVLSNDRKIDDNTFKDIRNLCGRIRRLLISSIKTLKSKKD